MVFQVIRSLDNFMSVGVSFLQKYDLNELMRKSQPVHKRNKNYKSDDIIRHFNK